MSDELLVVAMDPRMTPDAVRVVLYFASLGDGEHPYKFDDLSMLLEEAGEKRIRKALQRAEKCGYLERLLGGRGPDRFKRLPSASGRGEAVCPPQAAGEKPLVVEGEGDNTPYSPPVRFPVTIQAMRAIETAGVKLEGCRGALVDYLQNRIPSDRQYGYVQTIVAWIDNPLTTFRMPDGGPVPQEERTKLLAVALNEMSATDEDTRAHKSGDPINLRTKLGYVIKDRFGSRPPARASPKRSGAADQQEYTPTDEWRGFNG